VSIEGLAGRGEAGVWPLRRILAFIIAFILAFVLWLLVRPGSHSMVVAGDNIAQFAGPLAMLPICVRAFWMSRKRKQHVSTGLHAWSPLLLAAGAMFFGVGQMVYTAYEQVFGYASTPLPSWADPLYLAAYPCMLLGILWLPGRPLPATVRTRYVFDALIIMTAFVTFSWYFILGPTIIQGANSVLGQIVGTAYPLSDLVLISCLLFLSAYAADRALGRIIRTLWIGLGIIVVTDTVYDYQNLHGTYSTGSLVPDVGWPLGYMLIGLAAYIAIRRQAEPLSKAGETAADIGAISVIPFWRALLPYSLIPCIGVLVHYAGQADADPTLTGGVYAGSWTLLALLLVRQVLALLENRRLYGSLRQAFGELEESHRALEDANSRLEALATTDPLTGLPNHRALNNALDRELERAHRYGRTCAILFLDLDHFKALNDGFGHLTGDTVLREFAAVTKNALRGVDILGRWGGEEFLAILPETDQVAALSAAEHVRAAIAAFLFTAGGGSHLTSSVGVAVYKSDGEDRDALIAAADRAMYAAKSLGRNQVRFAGDPAIGALLEDVSKSSREDDALAGTVEAIATLVKARGSIFDVHALDVSYYAIELALGCGLSASEARMVGMASRLCDIGEVGVPDAVLRKQATLSREEWETIRAHPIVGEEVLSRVPALRVLAPIVRSHQEHWDGHGYPDQLAGEEIPLGARIIAVAAAYRSMRAERPYREARTRDWALAELRRCSGTEFDPAVVDVIERLIQVEAERETLEALGGDGYERRPRQAYSLNADSRRSG
jgi:two-component system cell cycle response regulator